MTIQWPLWRVLFALWDEYRRSHVLWLLPCYWTALGHITLLHSVYSSYYTIGLNCLIFYNVFLFVLVCVWTRVCKHVCMNTHSLTHVCIPCMHMCGSQRETCSSQFCPLTTWTQGWNSGNRAWQQQLYLLRDLPSPRYTFLHMHPSVLLILLVWFFVWLFLTPYHFDSLLEFLICVCMKV